MDRTSTDPRQRKDLLIFGYTATILLVPALLIAVSGDAPHILLLVFGGLFISMLKRRPLPRTSRTYIYSVVTAAAFTAFSEQLFPIAPNRYFLLPANIYGPMFLGLGVAVTFFDQREHTLTTVICLGLLSTMLGGNVVASFQTNPRFPISDLALKHFPLFFGVATALQISAMVLLLARTGWFTDTAATAANRFRWRRRLIIFCSLGIVFAGTFGLRLLGQYYERRMQHVFNELYQRYMSRYASRLIFSGRETDLWRTVDLRQRQDGLIVLRARSDVLPGYLRGRVYESYNNGRWQYTAAGSATMEVAMPGGRLAVKIYQRRTGSQPGTESLQTTDSAAAGSLHIYPSRNFRSDVLYAPGDAAKIEILADVDLRAEIDGTLRFFDWDMSGGYTLSPAPAREMTAFQGPLPDAGTSGLDNYLQIPEDLAAALKQIAKEIFADCQRTPSFEETLDCLENYFLKNFVYRLDLQIEGRDDPVLQFLNQYRYGHCEFFAAAGTLLLRSQGIPARYVTGIVCSEGAAGKTAWVARLKDMHAWVEAFDAETGGWHSFDPTPPDGRPQPRPDTITTSDTLSLFWQELLAKAKRGYVAEMIISSMAAAIAWLWALLRHPLRAPLILGLTCCFFWLLLQRQRRKRVAATDMHLPASRRELRKCLLLLEKKLANLGFNRSSNWTVREFCTYLKQAEQHPKTAIFRELLLEYESLRYRAEVPAPATVTAFKDKLRRQLRT